MEFSLREKKYAKTKLAILQEVVNHIESGNYFDDLSNKEICRRIEISEGTFYNHFPQRIDIFKYLFKLWEIEIRWHVKKEKPRLRGLMYLKEVSVVKHLCKNKNAKVLSQVLSIVAKQGVEFAGIISSDAEVYLAFPNYDGILDIQRNSHMLQIYIDHLEIAKKNSEVDPGLDSEAAAYAMLGVGISSIIFLKNEENIEEKIQKNSDWHMDIILEGIKMK